MYSGRLIKGIGGFYYVDINGQVFECKARGLFRKKKIVPAVGDYVEINILDDENKKGVIENIKKRHNELIRPSVSNIDQAIVVFAVTQPDPHLSLLDRFLVLAESQKLNIIICLNKIDLLDKAEYEDIVNIYTSAGYKVILTSSKQNKGIKDLREELKNKTTVFAGPSGVGKSTLLNHIHPGLKLQTGEISTKIARGKHTTRHAELMPVNENGWVVDTPGFSSLDMNFIHEDELDFHFPEFIPYIDDCKFNSCKHLNEPSCGVKKAVSLGKVGENRYNSYTQFIDEIRKHRRY